MTQDHRRLRRAAERRRSAAERELHHLHRDLKRDAETAAIVARSAIAEIGVRGLTRLATRLRARGARG